MKRLLIVITAVISLATRVVAQPVVTAGYGEIDGNTWHFQNITGPSKADLAQHASITVTAGQLHRDGGKAGDLVDGIVGASGSVPAQAVFFSNTSFGGVLQMDLGAVQAIRQVNSYAFHTWTKDQGGRTPQVYTLSGSVDGKAWTKIADVDSRPNQTGENWGSRPHGVQIAAADGELGSYRYLRWEIQPTQSPLTAKLQKAGETWSNTFFMELDVHSAATLTASQPARLFTPFGNLEEIILVYKSHFDIGYTHLASEAVRGYQTKVIDGALAVVDKNKGLPPEQQFVWTVPGWPMKKMLEDWDGQTPERLQRAREAFKSGRLAVHALAFTTQTELMEPESLVRSLGFASKISRNAGIALPTGAKMTDVPSHTKLLPTVLKNAGVNFLHLGCNFASQTARVPQLFFWEGPDGSRLLTMYSPTYGGSLVPPAGWKYKTWMALAMSGDNHPPPSPQKVLAQINLIKTQCPGVKVTLGTISDFADRMIQEDLSALPVVREDMPDTWIDGPMCDPEGIILARKAVPNLFIAESLHALLNSWDVATPDPVKAIAEGYENSNLFYEHTWGGAMYWISKYSRPKNGIGQCSNWYYGDKWKADLKTDKFDRHIASWEEHTDYARNLSKLVAPPLDDEMQALAKAVAVKGPRTVIFNPLPWERDAVVNGILVKAIPAGGYKTVPGKTEQSAKSDKSGKTILENAVFKITLDPERGTIKSMVDKRSGRELVDGNAAHGFGQYLHETFSANEVGRYSKAYVRGGHAWGYVELSKPNIPPASKVPYRALTPESFAITAKQQGDTSIIEMSASPKASHIDYPVTTRVSLHGDAPYVDIELTIDKPADNWPEAGWICLPFKVDAPQFRVGRNGFIMDPAKDIIEGANRYLYAAGTGVAVFDSAGHGVGVCGPDTPLVSLGVPGVYKFDRSYIPQKPVVYFNLFNNKWSTNWRFWNEGKWTYRFRVWSYDQYDAEASLITPSLEMRYPVQTAAVDAPAGKLPREQSGLSVSRAGVLVTAFGDNPDGAGTILRVWEQAGHSGKLTATIPGDFKTATPVSLRGEKTGEPIPIKGGTLTFNLGAYAPASFVLE